MAMRVKIFDLSSLPLGLPYKLTVQCAYWSLRVRDVRPDCTLNGAPLQDLAVAYAPDAFNVSLDFPPVFDGNGRPVMWNEQLVFGVGDGAILGTVTMVIWDPATPESPRR